MFAVYAAGLGLILLGLAALIGVFAVHGFYMFRNSVPYVVLPDGAIEQVSQALGIRDEDVVYDLGCGDGRVLMALQKLNPQARYFGVENDLVVWLLAKRRIRRQVRLVHGDIATIPLLPATRVYVYLGPKMMADLEPRFGAELPKGARVVSVQFPLPTRPPDEVIELTQSADYAARLYVYHY